MSGMWGNWEDVLGSRDWSGGVSGWLSVDERWMVDWLMDSLELWTGILFLVNLGSDLLVLIVLPMKYRGL